MNQSLSCRQRTAIVNSDLTTYGGSITGIDDKNESALENEISIVAGTLRSSV